MKDQSQHPHERGLPEAHGPEDAHIETDVGALTQEAMSARQAATFLDIEVEAVRRLFRSEKLSGFKFGGQWRTTPNHIRDYLIGELQKT